MCASLETVAIAAYERAFWGMRLVLVADRKGVPVGYDLVGPKTGQGRESALVLANRAAAASGGSASPRCTSLPARPQPR